jgi:hypothetical protein
MTTYQRPGIYIQENLNPLSNSFLGIFGEATPCFVAAYNIGPNVPVLINSWKQYTLLYGDFSVAGGSYLPFAVYNFFLNGGSSCFILRVENQDAVPGHIVLQDINTPTPDNVMTITSIYPGAFSDNIYVELTSAGQAGRFNINIYNGSSSRSSLVESFIDMSVNPADPRNVVSILSSPIGGSKYVMITESLPNGAYVQGQNDPALISPTALSGGSDGTTPPALATVVPTRLDFLQNQVLNVNLPGFTDTTVLSAINQWAQAREDVMVFIDGPAPSFPETSAQVVSNYQNMTNSLYLTTFAAIYAPWILVKDPSSAVPTATRWIPPCSAVLGNIQRADTLAGPQQSPAGIDYGSVSCVALETTFTPTDLDTLNTSNINAIKNVPGYGIKIFGARTLHFGYPDRYVAVRRVLMKLGHDFQNILLYALFMPNDDKLWKSITLTLENYLTIMMQQGVIGGDSPAQSFAVICDSSNNPPASAQSGIVNVSVAVALLSPAEFIIIEISQLTATS